MGLFGALNSAVQGAQAQGDRVAMIADNIANASTVGYKGNSAVFSTLVTNAGNTVGFSSGGVSMKVQTLVDKQGLIQSTGRSTDIAISGRGFIPVKDSNDSTIFTRAGSFNVNNKGELVNQAGYKLLAWPLDNEGRRPGEIGNINTTSAESFDSVELANTNAVSGTASATTRVSLGMNLDAGESVYQGATAEVSFASSTNNTITQDDVILPVSGMNIGDQFSLTADSVTSTFTYGGMARSHNIATAGMYGVFNKSTAFNEGTTLADGDKFRITTATSGAVTFTFRASTPNVNSGEFNSLATLEEAINNVVGLAARIEGNDTLYVASDDARDAITFANVGDATLVSNLGFSNVAVAGASENRFASLKGLGGLVSETTQLNYVINNPTSAANIEIFSKDPLQALTIAKVSNEFTINPLSSENGANGQNTLIVPVLGSSMAAGDTLTVNDGTNTGTFTYGGFETSTTISSTTTIFGASDPDTAFSTTIVDGNTLTINDGTNLETFTFDSTSPDTSSGDFNSMTTLAAAINSGTYFTARVANDTLYITPVTATLGMTFGGTAAVASGLGLANTSAASDRFNTLAQLSTLLDAVTDITTTVNSTSSNSTISVSTAASSITISSSSSNDLVYELGLAEGAVGDGLATELDLTAETVAATYDSADETKNMSNGNIQAQFSRNIRLFDSLGTGHDFQASFLKIGTNKWAMEVNALTPSEISSSRSDGQVAAGVIEFNGDGSLSSVTGDIASDISVTWSNGAVVSEIALDLGTAGLPSGTSGATVIGLTDGLRQFDTSYNVDFVQQNGVSAGQFNGIQVDAEGYISATFSNGEVKRIFQIPIVLIADPNSMRESSGNVFTTTQASGEGNLKQAGKGGAGTIVPGSVEGSTVDITEEITKTIETRFASNANVMLISTVNQMADTLNQRL